MIFRGLFCTFFLVGLCGVADAQGSTSGSFDLNKYVSHLMDLQVAFTKAPPTGIAVEMKEIGRQGASGLGLVVDYRIWIKGLPPDILLNQYDLHVEAEKPEPVLSGITTGKDGLLVCAGKAPEQCGDAKKPDDPVDFVFQPLKGEPYRMVLAPESGKPEIDVMIVPDPVEAKNKGCTVHAVRLNTTFQLAFIYGEGYPPDADVHYRFTSESKDEKVIHSDAKGVIRLAMLAGGNGKKSGHASFEVVEKECAPKISYEWGNP